MLLLYPSLVDLHYFAIKRRQAGFIAVEHGDLAEFVVSVQDQPVGDGVFRAGGEQPFRDIEAILNAFLRLGNLAGHDLNPGGLGVSISQYAEQRIIRSSAGAEFFGDLHAPEITLQRGGRLTEVCAIRIALHVTDSKVGRHQFLLQRSVAFGFLREAVEIFERGLDEHLARFGRAWQVLNLIVKVEEEGVGQFAHLRETAFSALALSLGFGALALGGGSLTQRFGALSLGFGSLADGLCSLSLGLDTLRLCFGQITFGARLLDLSSCALGSRDSGLMSSRDNAASQTEDHKRNGGDSQLMSAGEFAGAVSKGVIARDDRQAFQMASNVIRKLLD